MYIYICHIYIYTLQVCETITNAEEVAKIVSDKKRKNENVEEPGDERAKGERETERERQRERKRKRGTRG